MSQTNLEAIYLMAENLAKLAKACNVVVTIETKPLEPLSMGNHEMVVNVRPTLQSWRNSQ